MEQEQRKFRGIWIPADVWLDERLSAVEKVLLMEIDSLDNDKYDGCIMGNKRFSEMLQCSERTVSTMVSHLKELGYIKQESFDGRTRVLKSLLNENKGVPAPSKNCEAPTKNLLPNNIVNNKDRDNSDELRSTDISDEQDNSVGDSNAEKENPFCGSDSSLSSKAASAGEAQNPEREKVAPKRERVKQIPTYEEVKQYFSVALPRTINFCDEAEKFYEHYNVLGWKKSKNGKYADWVMLADKWIERITKAGRERQDAMFRRRTIGDDFWEKLHDKNTGNLKS